MTGTCRATLLGAALAVTPVLAETLHGEPPPGTVGLLSLPQILGGDGGVCAQADEATVALFEAPGGEPRDDLLHSEPGRPSSMGGCHDGEAWREGSDGARAPAWLMEHGYQAVSLIVIEPRPPWYRIAMPGAGAWVNAPHGRYRDLVDLYADGLTFLTSAWDGALCDGPDEQRACAVADVERLHREQHDAVEVLGWAQRPDGLWLEIRVISSPCLTDVQRTLPLRGWIPAQGRNRVPNVWFHSRGC